MEEPISLKEVFRVIRKWLWLIVSLTLGAGLIAAIISFYFLKPLYQNSSQFLVNQNTPNLSGELTENDVRTNVELINTYKVIIQSPRILDRVADELDLAISSEKLAEKTDVSSAESSQVVTVQATDPDPKLAAAIANTTVQIFQKEIHQLMNVNNVNILSEAELSPKPEPVAPNKGMNIAIAMVLGAMVAGGIAFLREYLDNTIKTESDIERTLQIPVLGVISHVKDKEMLRNQEAQADKNLKEEVVADGTS